MTAAMRRLALRPLWLAAFVVAIVLVGEALIRARVDWGYLIGSLVLLGALRQRTAPHQLAPAFSYGLPQMPDGPLRPPLVSARFHQNARATIVVVFVALVLVSAPGWAVVVAGVAAWLEWAASQEHVWRRSRHVRRLSAAVEAYGPTIGIGYAGRGGGPWQLAMWEPYLLRSGLRCVVFSRNASHTDMILAGANLQSPFIQLGEKMRADLKKLLPSTLTTLYYVQNAKSNAAYLAHKNLTHVWLNHGDSDKPANFNPRHANYDKIVVGGQAAIDRYQAHGIEIPRENIEIVGRPQTADIRTVDQDIATVEKPVVLYAPTWQGVNESVDFSSLDLGLRIVQKLIDRDITVIFRPHPLSRRWKHRREVVDTIDALLITDTAHQHVGGDMAAEDWSVADCANRADALISDVCSVVSDFLQSTKPYAMVNMRDSAEDFRTKFGMAKTAYVIDKELADLDRVLDQMLGPDPLAAARRQRKSYVLGDFEGAESPEVFAEFVRRTAGVTSVATTTKCIRNIRC